MCCKPRLAKSEASSAKQPSFECKEKVLKEIKSATLMDTQRIRKQITLLPIWRKV